MSQETPPPDRKQAKKINKNEFAGVSSIVQLAGVAAFIGAGYLGYREATNIFGQFDQSKIGVFFNFLIVGGIAGLVLLVIGGRMATKQLCSSCGNLLPNKEAKICAVCGARFGTVIVQNEGESADPQRKGMGYHLGRGLRRLLGKRW